MPNCPRCGHHLARTHRTAVEKLLYADVYGCASCGYVARHLHRALDRNFEFYCSRFTHCIRCGSKRIERLSKRDVIDSMSHHLVSLLFRLTGAPLKKCPACRLQYYDWRPIAPDSRRPAVEAGKTAQRAGTAADPVV
jgi:uncharacterized protein with PIN domain